MRGRRAGLISRDLQHARAQPLRRPSSHVCGEAAWLRRPRRPPSGRARPRQPSLHVCATRRLDLDDLGDLHEDRLRWLDGLLRSRAAGRLRLDNLDNLDRRGLREQARARTPRAAPVPREEQALPPSYACASASLAGPLRLRARAPPRSGLRPRRRQRLPTRATAHDAAAAAADAPQDPPRTSSVTGGVTGSTSAAASSETSPDSAFACSCNARNRSRRRSHARRRRRREPPLGCASWPCVVNRRHGSFAGRVFRCAFVAWRPLPRARPRDGRPRAHAAGAHDSGTCR